MAKTLAQLIVAVHDITPPSDDTTAYLNEAQYMLVMESNRVVDVDVTVVNGVFNCPVDCIKVDSVGWEGVALSLYYRNFFPDDREGTPRYYVVRGSAVQLYPAPAGGTATLIYCPAPDDMVQTADTSALDRADEALIAYAKHKIYIRQEDQAAAEFWESQWIKEAAKWIAEENKKHQRSYRLKAYGRFR